jgi:alkanesulfonate monooxygenase SsuD/methylene tetrahydromethanopterin reductase-like flavin-dependent oxidoreductase (luciferase family)
VRGPLNVARPVQGWPVIVQAGASQAGRQLAAETAEVVFGSSRTIEEARSFYKDVKARVTAAGRSADHFKILPGALVIVGRTGEEALEKKALLDSLVHPESGVPNLSIRLGVDASGFDLDGPLPEIPPSNQSQSGRDTLMDLARQKNDPLSRHRQSLKQRQRLKGGYRRATPQRLKGHVQHRQMVRHEEGIKPSPFQNLDEMHEVLQIEVGVGVGPRIAPPGGMNADRSHDGAKMKLLCHV